MSTEMSATHRRALDLNLDRSIYGTVAEIGAGQEVARWLFRVGGAAGTVAKSISAYDMTVSDEVYGKAGRYVSRERVVAMLDHEYDLLLARIGEKESDRTRLFAFADTVSARNYAGTNECHGWLGIRFQHEPGGSANTVLLHVNMLENQNLLQQEAVGILGINLIYAAFHDNHDTAAMALSLQNELSLERIEVDLAHLEGPAFAGVDPINVAYHLVCQGLTPAVVLQAGELAPPTGVVRKRAVVIHRGLFKEQGEVVASRIDAGRACLHRELGELEREPLVSLELSINPIHSEADQPDEEYLRRLHGLVQLGYPVFLTRFRENYELTSYLRRYSQEPLRFVAGVSNLAMLMVQEFYTALAGGLVEGIGKLFADNVKIYILPMKLESFRKHLQLSGIDDSFVSVEGDGLVGASSLHFKMPLGHLYRYLIEMEWITTMPGENSQ